MGERDLIIYQGATFRLPVIYKQDGVAVDLTGYTARMQLRADYDSLLMLASLTSEANGGLTIDAANGKVTAVISATDTGNFTVEEGVYDLEIESPSGEVTRLLGGKFTLSREVTR